MHFWLIPAALALVLLTWILNPLPDRHFFCGVRGFAWTDPGFVARSAQPSIASLACLRARGMAAVVNLRAEKPGYHEGVIAEGLGMDYLLLPIVDDTAPSPGQVSEYMKFVHRHRLNCAPILAHDAAGRGRMGVMDGLVLLWKGWSTSAVFERYIEFGAKIDCENGGNGQVQLLHDVGLLLGRGDAWPITRDQYGSPWAACRRPNYMADWDYRTVVFPPYSEPSCPHAA